MPRRPGPDRDAWRPRECPDQNSWGGLWQCVALNRSYPRSAMSKGRVEAFSDGVFAVAATLLIFNVQIDKTAPGELLGRYWRRGPSTPRTWRVFSRSA